MKVLGLIFLVAYISFCATLYVASRQHNVNQHPMRVAPQPVPTVQTAEPPAATNTSPQGK